MHVTLSLKFILLSILVLIFCTVPNLVLYNYIYSLQYETQIRQSSSDSLVAMDNLLNSLIKDVSDFSTSIISNESLQSMVKLNTGHFNPSNAAKIESTLFSISLSTTKVSSIILFDTSGNQYTYFRSPGLVHQTERYYQGYAWYERIKQRQGGFSVLTSDQIDAADQVLGTVSIVRQLNDLDNLQEIGLISVQIGSEILRKSFSPFTDRISSSLYLYQDDGALFFHLGAIESMDNIVNPSLLSNGESMIVKNGDKQFVVSKTTNVLSNLTMVSVSPADKIVDDLTGLKITSIIIAIASTVLLLLGTSFIFYTILKPLRELTHTMKSFVSNENFVPIYIRTSHDETEVLKNMYNKMIQKIQYFIQKSIQEEHQKQKVELLALQEQIKPHFLYNTLDTISSLALGGDNETVFQLTKSLSNFYRLSLSKGDMLIPLSQEIDILKNYVEILTVRYPDVFHMHFDIDDKTLSILVPKLILQPFVENSIYHGLRPLGETGDIFVRTKLDKGQFVIQIGDNGVGMSEEALQHMTDHCDQESHVSFGARTTIDRIRLVYGSETTITVKSGPGSRIVGTEITITISMRGSDDENKI